MFGRCLVRLVVLSIGLAICLAVVVALAVYAGLWYPPALGDRPNREPTPAMSARVPPPAQGVTSVNSLAELSSRSPSLRGQLIRVVIAERELTQEVVNYLATRSDTQVSDVKVRLKPGQVVLTGTARQGVLALSLVVAGHPVIVDGALKLEIDSVEPALVARFSQVAPGETIDLGLSFEARSVEVVDGQLLVTGVVQ